jgi:AmmeMemoRadiSam system protein B
MDEEMVPEFLNQPRPAAQAGRFYPADPVSLRSLVRSMSEKQASLLESSGTVALLAPHAGYIYSGDVAAASFSMIRGMVFDGVMILGPSHTHRFKGIALEPHASFLTPLGGVEADKHAIGVLLDHDLFFLNEEFHTREHAIEVELPFLQECLDGSFKLVASSIGQCSDDELELAADAVYHLVKDARTHNKRWLLIASSDTYHGYDPDACRANDQRLSELIVKLDHKELLHQSRNNGVMACGWMPLVVTLRVAERLGAREGLILSRDDSRKESWRSGDYVVGYLGAGFSVGIHSGQLGC